LTMVVDVKGRLLRAGNFKTVNGQLNYSVARVLANIPTAPPPQPAATPVITPPAGSYNAAQNIQVACGTDAVLLRFTLDGSDPTETSTPYAGWVTLTNSATLKVKAFKTGMLPSETAQAAYSISIPPPVILPPAPKAVFITSDTATGGNWTGVYGTEGALLIGSQSQVPSYVEIAPKDVEAWIWSNDSPETRALQIPGSAQRIAGCWYGGLFSVTLNFKDTAAHRVAAYFCDWDSSRRVQRIDILNAETGAVLWTRTISNFHSGEYLVWNLQGKVRIRCLAERGDNTILNGLLFGE
jgi:hypothetical protein